MTVRRFRINVASGAPQWLANATPNAWVTAPTGGLMSSVFATIGTVPGFSSNPRSALTAYTGCAYDHDNHRLLSCAGGGHQDYVGNETYALALNAVAPTWTRLNDPTPAASVIGYTNNPDPLTLAVYGDGKPRAMHTYGFATYASGKVWFPYQSKVTSTGGTSTRSTLSFDLTSHAWASYGLVSGETDYQRFEGGCSALDPATGDIWSVGSDAAMSLYPLCTWRMHTQGAQAGQAAVVDYLTYASQRTAWFVFDPTTGVYLRGEMGSGIIDVYSPGVGWARKSPTGTAPAFTWPAGASVYNGSVYLLGPHDHQGRIYRLEIPSSPYSANWTDRARWSVVTNSESGGPQTEPGSWGSTGRARVVTIGEATAMIYQGDADAQLQVFRMS